MNQAVRDRIVAEAARRNGIDPERLAYLQDHRDQVGSRDETMLEPFEAKGRELDLIRGGGGELRTDPFKDMPKVAEKTDGKVKLEAYKDEAGGVIYTRRGVDMDWIKKTTPKGEPLVTVPVLGMGRRTQDRVDAKLIAATIRDCRTANGGFEVGTSLTVSDASLRVKSVDDHGAVMAIAEMAIDPFTRRPYEAAIIAVDEESLRLALGEKATPTTFEGWLDYGREAGLTIEQQGNRWKLNGKRISKKKMEATLKSPMAIAAVKDDANSRALNIYGEPFQEGDQPYNPYYGVVQRDTPELYESGGIWERMFDSDQRLDLTGSMAERSREVIAAGKTTAIVPHEDEDDPA